MSLLIILLRFHHIRGKGEEKKETIIAIIDYERKKKYCALSVNPVRPCLPYDRTAHFNRSIHFDFLSYYIIFSIFQLKSKSNWKRKKIILKEKKVRRGFNVQLSGVRTTEKCTLEVRVRDENATLGNDIGGTSGGTKLFCTFYVTKLG